MGYQTLLYYKYVAISHAAEFATKHLEFCISLGLKGRILIGDEGINGTVSGTEEQCYSYMNVLNNDELLNNIEFKVDTVEAISFNKMHVRYRPEIVVLGNNNHIDPNKLTGIHLQPHQFMQMKDDDDVIILDTRNNVEHQLGKFKNAKTLNIDHFRDFPEAIKELEPFKEKKILAYCTGGIRCEKATAFLIEKGFKNVYQLHGGIIQYGKETQGIDFEGRCYVFDKRLSVDVNKINPKIITQCKNCNAISTRMVNCANPLCNEHFVQCDSCGEDLEGCCSDVCLQSEVKRPYNDTGYYAKGDLL